MDQLIEIGKGLGPFILTVAAVILALKQILPVVFATPKKAMMFFKNFKAMTLKDIYNDLTDHTNGIHDLTIRVEEIESLPVIRESLIGEMPDGQST